MIFETGARSPRILIGVTSAQTCVILADRARAFREAGFDVTLLSSPGELLHETRREAGVKCHAVPMRRGIAPLADWLALIRICIVLRRVRPDIVEFSTPKAGLLGSIAARLCGVPARVYLLRGLRLETVRGVKRRLLLAAERIAARCAQAVVCNSRSLQQEALALRLGAESKLLVLGQGSSNGVDTARFSPGRVGIRGQLGIPKDSPVIGFVGRLTADKGIPELLEAFAALLHTRPNAHLLLVGWFDASEDAIDSRLRKRIESHPQITCTGLVQDTSPYYGAMDVMVLPSWREGFPNALLEAAASGVPAVATNCTGSRDAVIPGVTGLLVQPGKPEAICAAVASLLDDPEQREGMSKATREWVAKNYETRDVLGKTVAFYGSLIRPEAEQVAGETLAIGEGITG